MTFTQAMCKTLLEAKLPCVMAMDVSSGNSSDPDEELHVFGVINGILVRKYPMTVNTYPDLHDFVERLVDLLERIYELAFRRGTEVERPGILDSKKKTYDAGPDSTSKAT